MNASLDTFTDMLTREWVASPGGFEAAWLVILMSFCLGQLIAWVYMRTHTGLSYSRTFTVSMVVLPTIVALVMMVMIDNIIVAFGLFAVFAIVRFRNIVKDTRDTTFVLWAIVTGLSVGTMRFSLAVAGCAFLALAYFYLHSVGFGTRAQFDSMLTLLWRGPQARPSEGETPMGALTDLLKRYTLRADLAHQRTGEGGAVRLTYHLTMRDPARGPQLLEELEALGNVEDASIYKREDESEI